MRSTMRILGPWVLLATLGLPARAMAGSFTFEAADQGAVTDLAVVSAFTTTVRNTGTAADTYTVTMTKEMPADWSGSLCQGTICYPPFIEQISFSLDAGAATNLDVDLTPLVTDGAGSARVTVASQGSPTLVQVREFRVVTSGVEVLLVDGDGGQDLEDHYIPALAASALSWARWPRHEAGALSTLELDAFNAVIWFAEGMFPGLTDADRTALAYYVQHGGSLLLAGQDLAWQACDPVSPWYSAQAAAWFPVVLGTSFAGPAGGVTQVAGLPGAPFARAFGATLNAAGGAGNSRNPAALTAANAGVLAQAYGGGAGAAVVSSWGAGRSLFCGYALESVGSADLAAFLDGFLGWARGLPSGVSSPPPGSRGGALTAAPNPFNPSTTLRFDLTAGDRVRVEICDLRGRVVRRLASGMRTVGPVALVWDGRDDAGASVGSGVYLARVTTGASVRVAKLVLAK